MPLKDEHKLFTLDFIFDLFGVMLKKVTGQCKMHKLLMYKSFGCKAHLVVSWKGDLAPMDCYLFCELLTPKVCGLKLL